VFEAGVDRSGDFGRLGGFVPASIAKHFFALLSRKPCFIPIRQLPQRFSQNPKLGALLVRRIPWYHLRSIVESGMACRAHLWNKLEGIGAARYSGIPPISPPVGGSSRL